MKKNGSSQRETVRAIEFQRRLRAYSTLAAIGACAGVGTSAHAAIVYSGAVNIAVPATATGGFANLSTFAFGTTYAAVNGGDATAPALNLWGTTASRAWLYPTASTVNRFVSDGANFPLELSVGAAINSTTVNGTSTQPTALTVVAGSEWTAGTTGYLGFKFLNGTITEYGWAQISVPVGAPAAGNQIRVLGIAYDNTGAFINAGQTAVPEPGTVAALAAGAIGVGAVAWRRRKTA